MFVDMPGSAATVDVVVAAAQLDALVLVVSALDGVTSRTAELLFLARQTGVRHVLAAITKTDAADAELVDVVALETADLVAHGGHARGGAPTADALASDAVAPASWGTPRILAVTSVSALGALQGESCRISAIRSLLSAVDRLVPPPVRTFTPPFLLPVQRVAAADGVAVTGVIRRGRVRVGQTVDPERLGSLRVISPRSGRRVTGIERLGKPVREARAGDPVTLFLQAELDTLRHAPVVAAHYTFAWRRRFTAWVHLHGTSADPLAAPVSTGFAPGIDFGAVVVLGRVDLGPIERIGPGEDAVVQIDLRNGGLPLAPGLEFTIRSATQVIGAGVVLAVAPGESAHHHMPTDW
ncbi:GTP-binding protein [Yinghuangia sp. ASG 101]|nr:GTP-binding protein [Yinghuangia sp. ASG 101]